MNFAASCLHGSKYKYTTTAWGYKKALQNHFIFTTPHFDICESGLLVVERQQRTAGCSGYFFFWALWIKAWSHSSQTSCEYCAESIKHYHKSAINELICQVFMPLFISFLWSWYVSDALREFLHIWHKGSHGIEDELTCFWCSKVKGQNFCDLTKHVFGNWFFYYDQHTVFRRLWKRF